MVDKSVAVISRLNAMSQKDLEALATGLVWFDGCLAERLKNCIAYAQQERDQAFLNQWEAERQAEMMADQDAIFYGERI